MADFTEESEIASNLPEVLFYVCISNKMNLCMCPHQKKEENEEEEKKMHITILVVSGTTIKLKYIYI